MTRFLVVDDSEENRYYLSALLAGNGDAVDVARHGAEALVVARRSRPDLVVSDLLMPVMDGYTLLRQWKSDAQLRDIPFVVYTATYTEPADEQLALDLGADAFILKPAEPDDFLDRMREVLARGDVRLVPPTTDAVADDPHLLKSYSETLIRKLEEKTFQLEEANEALRADIAARERAEVALRASEAEFRLLVESVPNVVWVASPDGRATDFNEWWVDFSGMSVAESRGNRWFRALHPDDHDRTVAAWRDAADAGTPFEIEYRLRRADGQYRWMLARALPMRDDAGVIVKWLGTWTDVHDLKEAQGRIAEQARLLDQTHDAVAVHDLDQRVLYWNAGAERLHGWAAADAVGRTIDELHCRDVEQLATVMNELGRRGEWNGELRLVDRDGQEIIVEARWTLLYDDPEPGAADDRGTARSVLAVHTDVTDRKRIEARLDRARRLESIGTLAGGIAHDLNNLLAPITMGTSLLQEQDLGELDDVVAMMATSAERGTEIVRQILSFARGFEGRREPVRIADVVAEVLAVVRASFPDHISVETEFAPWVPEVTGDPTQLHQVLLNLCVNARDAMPDGGRLLVTLAVEQSDELDHRHGPHDHAHAHDDTCHRVVVGVVDTGNGIDDDLLERIFEPFMTTKQPGAGTGLGLSTVIGVVNAHGGFVDVDSRVGEGSRFTVSLPAAPVTS